jgi:hypothetical protein
MMRMNSLCQGWLCRVDRRERRRVWREARRRASRNKSNLTTIYR